MKTVDNRVAVLVDLCYKHGCTPDALFSSISLNPVPKELMGLKGEELVSIKEEARRILKSVKENDEVDNINWVIRCIKQGVTNPQDLTETTSSLSIERFSQIVKVVTDWFQWADQVILTPIEHKIVDELIHIFRQRQANLCNLHNVYPDDYKRIFQGLTLQDAWLCIYRAEKLLKIKVEPKDTFQDVLDSLKPDLIELSLRAESYQIEITKILEELARNVYKTFNYKKESGGVGLVIGRGQVAYGFRYKDYKDLTPSESKDALEELKRIIVEDFQPWVKSQLGN